MKRVIVIGGANVDIKGQVSGAFIGGTSNPGEVLVSVGGVGRNIADNLARLGVAVSLLTVLGDDANGQLVREATAAAGVDLSLTLTGPAATGTYLVILDRHGEVQCAVNDMQNIEWLTPKHLDAVAAQLAASDMLVADCNIDVSCLDWLCDFSARNGVRLLIEPVSVPKSRKLLKFERHSPVFAVTPNEQQLAALTHGREVLQGLESLRELGFTNVVLHRGARGAAAASPSGRFEVRSYAAGDVADVTGAGDAAVAGLVAGLLEGLDLQRAVNIGQAAASLKLSSRQSVSEELNRDRIREIAGF